MKLSDAIADAESLFASIFKGHPEIEADLQNAATDAVQGLKDAATTAVAGANLPPAVVPLLDAAIADAQDAVDKATAHLAELVAAKGVPVPAA